MADNVQDNAASLVRPNIPAVRDYTDIANMDTVVRSITAYTGHRTRITQCIDAAITGLAGTQASPEVAAAFK